MRLAIVSGLAAALAACNPYDPNLPPEPFTCGTGDPPCPGGYTCSGSVCVEVHEGPDAPPTPSDARCLDLAEPNDTLQTATFGQVWDQLDHIVLESLTLCPATDKDYFRVIQPTNCGAAPPCPNLDALVKFELIGSPPMVSIRGATGNIITPGGSTGTPGEIKAVFNNVPQGTYYILVEVMTVGLPHYQLTIDGRRL